LHYSHQKWFETNGKFQIISDHKIFVI